MCLALVAWCSLWFLGLLFRCLPCGCLCLRLSLFSGAGWVRWSGVGSGGLAFPRKNVFVWASGVLVWVSVAFLLVLGWGAACAWGWGAFLLSLCLRGLVVFLCCVGVVGVLLCFWFCSVVCCSTFCCCGGRDFFVGYLLFGFGICCRRGLLGHRSLRFAVLFCGCGLATGILVPDFLCA